MKKAPGKHYRNGLSLAAVTAMFPDDAAAERWFVAARWPNGVQCPKCNSNNILERASKKPQPYRCRDCRKYFSVKTGTLMHGSNLGLRIWALGIYLMATGLRGRSSMQLHRDLGVTQKTAWYLAHRIRENWKDQNEPYEPFKGPVEVDESYFGGKRKFMHRSKREKLTGRGTAGKVAVAAVRDRDTKKVSAQVVRRTDAETLQSFVTDRVEPGTKIYTDEAHAYRGLLNHESVKHSVGEYVREQAHVNGLESFWATMKRGFNGTYYRMSPKHLHRYVDEFAGRFNDRPYDTIDQMEMMVRGMEGKHLRYQDLVK